MAATAVIKPRVILLSNFYNEEYLLPFWLNHHKNMFDHAIILDYNSTDKSADIIREICPTWEIRSSKNADFSAAQIDAEFMEIEAELPIHDYKIILNTTEFLCCYPNWRDSLRPNAGEYIEFKSLAPVSAVTENYPHNLKQLFSGITNINVTHRSSRFMHTHQTGQYTPGRHTPQYPITNRIPGFICWLGFYPWNQCLIGRKLQISHRIPAEDRAKGWGFQHLWSHAEQNAQMVASFMGSKHISKYPGFVDIIRTLYG